ncbi:unnamed protein product [Effrenium voratum]|uniref:Uncharacterized protein n=1 Tax=Effrenium voratum TaxID=2562239 RepID=A0AA36NCL8_9DINO|nr:unnamed protein product [Effrenium voratum]CAJ1397343.1 unnamed protein product [Effrenium voratum]CAJ1425717.1 unnamed protein product [Effrenium voratum]
MAMRQKRLLPQACILLALAASGRAFLSCAWEASPRSAFCGFRGGNDRGGLIGGGTNVPRMADYSMQAARMFDNMRGPAVLLAGAIVPLGFFAAPRIEKDDPAWLKRGKRLHYLLASIAICCELVAVVWSTIAVNKLNETNTAPARSLMELLQRDYELPWIGCNVNFIFGLMGFASLLVSFSYVSFGPVSRPIACTVLAAECFIISIVNDGVVQGDGQEGGLRFGCNLFSLVRRYLRLLLVHAVKGQRIMVVASFLMLFLAAYYLAKLQLQKQED